MRLAEKLKHRDLQATLRCVRAHAQAALGQWDEAAECYKASVALFREARPRDHAARLMAGLARIALSRGDPIWIYLTCHDGLAACRGVLDHCAPAPQDRAALLGDEERRSGHRLSPTYPPIAPSSPLGRRLTQHRPDLVDCPLAGRPKVHADLRYGSAHDPPAAEFAAPELPLRLGYPEAVPRDRVHPTQRRQR
jgi:hypothetical protein